MDKEVINEEDIAEGEIETLEDVSRDGQDELMDICEPEIQEGCINTDSVDLESKENDDKPQEREVIESENKTENGGNKIKSSEKIQENNSDSETESSNKKTHTIDGKDVEGVSHDEDTKNDKQTDEPSFIHIDTEKEEEKNVNTNDQDEQAVDPIGESTSDWSHDDTECIVPDNNQNQDDLLSSGVENDDQSTSNVNESTDTNEYPEWAGKYIVTISKGDEQKSCMICEKEEVPKYTCTLDKNQMCICSEDCLKHLKEKNVENVIVRDLRVKNFAPKSNKSGDNFRKCAECGLVLIGNIFLCWECLEFCTITCIKNYQKKIGSHCATCKNDVTEMYIGKYCVRFGFDVRQFCSGPCLTEYKKGLKACLYCRKPIDDQLDEDQEYHLDFCSVTCQTSYAALKDGTKETGSCAVCHEEKLVEIEYTNKMKRSLFCSEPCFLAYKYVNSIDPEKCGMCTKYYHKKHLPLYIINTSGVIIRFCSKTCQNVYININRKIVACCWCKVKKYNYDMIQKVNSEQCIMWCSSSCQKLFEAKSLNPGGKRKCTTCLKTGNMVYHITTDTGIKSYCSYKCVKNLQTNQVLRVTDISAVPGFIKRVTKKATVKKQIIPDTPAPLPIITSVRSLANDPSAHSPPLSPQPDKPSKCVIMVRPAEYPDVRNVMTVAKPLTANAETSAKTIMVDKETQTDMFNPTDLEVVPVPIYIPQPIHMFNLIDIKPLPFALPIPVPIMIPMTKTGISGILKEVKTTQPTPSDPYEADLLVMAQLVADANDKEAEEEQTADSEPEDTGGDDAPYSPEPQEAHPSFGDDVLQMALHMATDFTEPAVDLEGALTANTITANPSTTQTEDLRPPKPERGGRGSRRRGRGARGGRGRGRGRPSNPAPVVEKEPSPEPPPEPVEKPDANMCLKYTFGVNAWKQWVSNKNQELEKSSRRVKLFKTDLLQLTSDELNYSLCLFIKEVRKPNGTEYAPDTIYYLCLGIQQYLFENGRIDNIFCDPYYESFTDCLDDICKKFSTLYNDSQYIVTRVEEEHLWESKQLGAHSPHVLLSTLMFFNTKHFNLTNVDEHMQLSFSHIMKHWKRVPNTPGTSKNASSRNILLRFYPPQSAVDGNRKKKVYEQQENEENPIRCPVKLYEFYLSKCPESVKSRNDVFYLQPERSCVPDSPVWYSTMALGKDSLEKMLHRVKMVKEINVALLSS